MQGIGDYVALDLETTGLRAKDDRIIEIGAIKYIEGKKTATFATFINPQMDIPQRITEITGIDNSMVEGAPIIGEVIHKLIEFIGELPLLGHNIMFDYGFIKQKAMLSRIEINMEGIDTLKIAKLVLPGLPSKSLENLCLHYGIVEEPRHRAFSDAAATARLYECLCREKIEDEVNEKIFLPAPLVYQVKKDCPLTKKQEEFLGKLIKQHNIKFDKEIGSLTKSQASREIDLILSSYGRV